MRPSPSRIASFPTVSIPSEDGGLPVEVALIAQLGHGAGDQLHAGFCARQRAHPLFVDALQEPSARLAGSDLTRHDATALYTFAVGEHGHPFHRHAGHRIFTAISGSGGTQLRFATAGMEQLHDDPEAFFRTLHFVDIPPDCLFTVRFGGGTWHQFAPLRQDRRHPAMLALSCHTNELGGDLPPEQRVQVERGEASIPSLTELLPASVVALIDMMPWNRRHVPTTRLALDAPPTSLLSRLCGIVRAALGRVRYRVADRRNYGFSKTDGKRFTVVTESAPSPDALLLHQLESKFHHQDSFSISLGKYVTGPASASLLLSHVLDGFIHNSPASVSRMMAIRNALVRPLGLRTSRLGCPASSLLSKPTGTVFAGKHPVLAERIDEDDRFAQVVLGADDKHLRFRSCVAVRVDGDGAIQITLGTRVQCKNLFGHVYMRMIEPVHRRHVSPVMLRMATEFAFRSPHSSLAILKA